MPLLVLYFLYKIFDFFEVLIMKKIAASLILIFMSLSLLSGCVSKPVKLDMNGKKFSLSSDYTLVFEDNFEFLDLSKWKLRTFENNLRRAAYYVGDDDVVSCKNGNLVMSAKFRNGIKGNGYYTSWLESSSPNYGFGESIQNDNYSGFTANKGYFEIRCIPLKAIGIWSAFWMLPNNGDTVVGSSDGAEIDIMESHFWPQEKISNKMCHAIHVDEALGSLKSALSEYYIIENFYEEFHTFGVEWTDKEYIFNIDNIITWKTNHYEGTSGALQYLNLSIEVAGENNGEIATKYGTNENNIATNNDPTKTFDYIIDYVKVYQKA